MAVMNEIFGEENFVSTMIHGTSAFTHGKNECANHLSVDHDCDTIVIYAKNKEIMASSETPKLLRTEEADARTTRIIDEDPRGPWKPSHMTACNKSLVERPNLY